MMALPEGYCGTDSNSYFETTTSFWTENHLALKSKRRWIYPLLLLPTPALPGRTVTVIAFAQHVLGLGLDWLLTQVTLGKRTAPEINAPRSSTHQPIPL